MTLCWLYSQTLSVNWMLSGSASICAGVGSTPPSSNLIKSSPSLLFSNAAAARGSSLLQTPRLRHVLGCIRQTGWPLRLRLLSRCIDHFAPWQHSHSYLYNVLPISEHGQKQNQQSCKNTESRNGLRMEKMKKLLEKNYCFNRRENLQILKIQGILFLTHWRAQLTKCFRMTHVWLHAQIDSSWRATYVELYAVLSVTETSKIRRSTGWARYMWGWVRVGWGKYRLKTYFGRHFWSSSLFVAIDWIKIYQWFH